MYLSVLLQGYCSKSRNTTIYTWQRNISINTRAKIAKKYSKINYNWRPIWKRYTLTKLRNVSSVKRRLSKTYIWKDTFIWFIRKENHMSVTSAVIRRIKSQLWLYICDGIPAKNRISANGVPSVSHSRSTFGSTEQTILSIDTKSI